MRHFWINVDKNEKRKIFMENQFKKLDLKNLRVSAITPRDFDYVLAQKRPLSCKHPGCTSCEYEYACLCSHIKALQLSINSCDDEWFIILEDDIFLPFNIDYVELIKTFPKDADIIQTLVLYGPTTKHLYDIKKAHDINYIKWKYLFPSTGMYIISRAGANKLIALYYNKSLKKYDFSNSTCQNVADVLLYSSVNTYVSTFPLAYPFIEMGSEIHPDHLIAHEIAIKDIKEVVESMKLFNNLNFIKDPNDTI